MRKRLLPYFEKFTLRSSGLLIFAFLLTSHIALAHLGKITGTVSDAATGRPLTGVTVLLAGQSKGAITNDLGQYQLTDLPAATYRLEFTSLGF